MIGMYAAVANANHMAVWGGADPLLGTNPLAIRRAVGRGPLVLDMATTVVSYGTVKNYALQGKPMQPGWMVNTATGEDIIDAKRAAEGLLLPIGGYKGSGLAVMLGLIGGPLNRAVFGRDVVDFNADDASETNTGHFIVALDVARFLPLDDYKAEVDRHIRELKDSKRLPGVDEIRMPGERRRQCREERLRDGVPLAPPLVAQLDKMAAELVKTLQRPSEGAKRALGGRRAAPSFETHPASLRMRLVASSGNCTGCLRFADRSSALVSIRFLCASSTVAAGVGRPSATRLSHDMVSSAIGPRNSPSAMSPGG